MAWTRKSSRPQVFSISAKAASIEDASVTSQGIVSVEPTEAASGCTRFFRASPW